MFKSLTHALEGCFDKALAELPEALQEAVQRAFLPLTWDALSPARRQAAALQADYQDDPGTQQERQYWWDFFEREEDLKQQAALWAEVATPTAGDVALKEARLAELHGKLSRMDQQRRHTRGDYYPVEEPLNGGMPPEAEGRDTAYLAYPRALSQLMERLGATPEELAAWVWWGPDNGGIAAYLNANELDPPPRFSFPLGNGDFEYVPYLMACWFKQADIDRFEPADRYITGQALIEEWGTRTGISATAYIQAKIAESRLMEMHPLYGITQGSWPDNKDFPPLTSGLFSKSEIRRIEVKDFPEPFVAVHPASVQRLQNGASSVSVREGLRENTKASSPTPSTIRRDARKLETEKLYKGWQIAYRKSKKKNPEKSDVWHSQQISKLDIAQGRDSETIRKNMKS